MEKKEIKNLLVMSILAGKIMLRNGAETYRVEDTIARICKSRNIQYVQTFVTPTGIFLSVEHEDDLFSYIQRIKSITIDLHKIDVVNNFSRNFVNSDMTISEGMDILNNIEQILPYKSIIRYLFAGFAGSFFTLMFGGSLLDFLATFLTSSSLLVLIDNVKKLPITFFLSNVIGGIFVTLFSIILYKLGIGENINVIIIGSLMLLVPGVVITNAIRDSISGDFISGVSRAVEATIIALAIAFGVGVTLKLIFNTFGQISNIGGLIYALL
ncbi:threonine/serine exporter family protein [Clostridium sp. D2Q-11]|uniref:Threonine/serine exporter family protein n=1 Tax=Anaeromonas frigoriresistens TaxID=2683708 RepID=A0A942V0L2_9FIRM|nr:threonine/serine exporter family protein [Anaeromonas frigoriresistens]MBS4539701.1 threonine/serine exporter family protein [Anaeromonas frigoriresistens]